MIRTKTDLINKLVRLSEHYHKLSLLYYELSQSIRIQSKKKGLKELKDTIKDVIKENE